MSNGGCHLTLKTCRAGGCLGNRLREGTPAWQEALWVPVQSRWLETPLGPSTHHKALCCSPDLLSSQASRTPCTPSSAGSPSLFPWEPTRPPDSGPGLPESPNASLAILACRDLSPHLSESRGPAGHWTQTDEGERCVEKNHWVTE